MQKGESFVGLISKFIEDGNFILPVFNPVAMRIQQELVKKEPDVRILEQVISGDQSLSSQVLQMANSAFYRGLVEVLTVRAAIVRLGMREVGRISLLAASKNQFRSKDQALNMAIRRLWQHSFGCAMGVKWLANRCKFEDLEAHAFFAGLLHDVGKLFVLMVVDQMRSSEREAPVSDALLLEAMDALHTEQGYRLMKKWNIPEQYCIVARDHHLPGYDTKNFMLILIRIANMVCNKIGIGLHQDPSLVVSATDEALQLNLSEIDLAELEILLEDSSALST
jgi:HD-like signal output (HDOD) protein